MNTMSKDAVQHTAEKMAAMNLAEPPEGNKANDKDNINLDSTISLNSLGIIRPLNDHQDHEMTDSNIDVATGVDEGDLPQKPSPAPYIYPNRELSPEYQAFSALIHALPPIYPYFFPGKGKAGYRGGLEFNRDGKLCGCLRKCKNSMKTGRPKTVRFDPLARNIGAVHKRYKITPQFEPMPKFRAPKFSEEELRDISADLKKKYNSMKESD